MYLEKKIYLYIFNSIQIVSKFVCEYVFVFYCDCPIIRLPWFNLYCSKLPKKYLFLKSSYLRLIRCFKLSFYAYYFRIILFTVSNIHSIVYLKINYQLTILIVWIFKKQLKLFFLSKKNKKYFYWKKTILLFILVYF